MNIQEHFNLVAKEKHINVIENTDWADFLFYEMNIDKEV